MVLVNVTNFNLVNKLGQANASDEGHIHYYIDVPVPIVAGKPATTATGTLLPANAPTLKTMGIDNVVVNLIAKGIEFNSSKITVSAAANVTLNFDNQDSGIPHNVAIYTDNSAKTTIFQGKVITGPAMITYNFVAPTAPGTYFFRCDIHPQMNGQFIVK